MGFKEKYLKYKQKYLELKNNYTNHNRGGGEKGVRMVKIRVHKKY